MAIGAGARSDESVLRLLHPGGYVEIHRRPAVASKFMEENPLHFVTGPDVFQFPWIVVRPESILMPGKAGMMAINSGVGMLDERNKTAGAKSCLKKQLCSGSKDSLGRRVVFVLPDDRVAVWSGHGKLWIL